MKKPTKQKIAKLLKQYRRTCEKSKDPIEARVAQAMEMAIIWSTKPTDWRGMDNEPRLFAKLIREEMEP